MTYPFEREITKDNPFKVCFVCLGNICRSPTAEGLFIHKVKEARLDLYFYIDSAGTAAYHVGEPANSKSQATANQYGVHLPSRARKFDYSDFEEFDLILAMDASNYDDLKNMDIKNRFEDKLYKMRTFDPVPEDENVPDPYYGGQSGFENVYAILDRAADELLSVLKKHIQK